VVAMIYLRYGGAGGPGPARAASY